MLLESKTIHIFYLKKIDAQYQEFYRLINLIEMIDPSRM